MNLTTFYVFSCSWQHHDLWLCTICWVSNFYSLQFSSFWIVGTEFSSPPLRIFHHSTKSPHISAASQNRAHLAHTSGLRKTTLCIHSHFAKRRPRIRAFGPTYNVPCKTMILLLQSKLRSHFCNLAWNLLYSLMYQSRCTHQNPQAFRWHIIQNIYLRLHNIILPTHAWVHSWNVLNKSLLNCSRFTVWLLVLAFSIGKPSPPHSFILLNLCVLQFSACRLAKTKPEEGPLAVLFVLMVLSDEDVAVGEYLTSSATFLIIAIAALVESSVSVDGDTLICKC